MKEYIKEYPSGKILGWIDDLGNGDAVARSNPNGNILGYYRKGMNATTAVDGHIIARGNCLTALIYNQKR